MTSFEYRRKSASTELTTPISGYRETLSEPFFLKDLGEPDCAQFDGQRPHSTQSLSSFSDTTSTSARLRAYKSNTPMCATSLHMLDSMPCVPRRRNSLSSNSSGSDIRDVYNADYSTAEDDTIFEPSVVHHQPETHDRPQQQQQQDNPDNDSNSSLPMDRFASDRTDYDQLSPPIRVGSVSSAAKPSFRKKDTFSGEVTDEAIENMIISQIPEHIRKQMTPYMWKEIFAVDAIQKHSGVASVCSDLSEDVLSIRSQRSTTKLVDHTGLVVKKSLTRENIDSTFDTENLESQSTSRGIESIASGDGTQDMDINSGATPSTYRSINLGKEDSSTVSSSSSLRLTLRSTGSSKHSSSTSTCPTSTRSVHHERHAATKAARDKKDDPPQVPIKIRSRQTSARNSGSLEASDRSSRRVPTERVPSVRFCPEADVRNYERVLEVHPSTSSDPSVGIGWKYVESTPQVNWCGSLDKRSVTFLLSREAREHIVRIELGYSAKQISEAVRKNWKIKNQRRRTVNSLHGSFVPVEKVEYMIEKYQNKLGRLRLGRQSSNRKTGLRESVVQ